MTLFASVGEVRGLGPVDLPAVERMLAEDPVTHCFVTSRVRAGGLDPWRTGGELLGFTDDDGLRSMLHCGANLVPVCTTEAARDAFASRLRGTGRRSSSIVGPQEEVLGLWSLLQQRWGAARDVRACQPLLVIDHEPRTVPDPCVRPATLQDLDLLVPACVAMFTEEVGVSPVAGGMHAAYRARIAELISTGRSFVRIDNGVVVFKAEIGAATSSACQVQGVWVNPQFRGRGLSVPGMAAVVEWSRSTIAPVVSLYVNDYNTAARRCYEAVGFRDHGLFATVLF